MTAMQMEMRPRFGFPGYRDLVGGSDAIRETFHTIETVGRTMPHGVLVEGEPGTGKELVSRALHQIASSDPRPFVTVDCGRVDPEQLDALLDSLAGDASVPVAPGAPLGGTLLLDELGRLSEEHQSDLAEALRRADRDGPIRVVATSSSASPDGLSRVHPGLLGRVSGVRLQVPALRARSGDGDLLFRYFLHASCRRSSRRLQQVHSDVLRRIEEYDWPGNVRELEAVAHRCISSSRGERIETRHLPPHVGDAGSPALATGPSAMRFLLPRDGVVLEDVERDLVTQALERTGGNQSRAARLLGINRFALRTRMRRHNLFAPSDEDTE